MTFVVRVMTAWFLVYFDSWLRFAFRFELFQLVVILVVRMSRQLHSVIGSNLRTPASLSTRHL